MAIREGRWDCAQCGTQGNLGRHKLCPACGHPRPEGVKFYLPEDAPAVERGLAEEALQGADWICGFCGASNAAEAESCKQCNAGRAEAIARQQVREYGMDEVPRSAEAPPPVAALHAQAAPSAAPPFDWSRLPWKVLAPVALLFLCALFFFTRGESLNATVTGLEWERTITVEALRSVTEEGWEVPQGGRILSEERALHHTEQELVRYEERTRQVSERVQVGTRSYVCGQRDLGNGFFEDIECEDPVYETEWRTESYREPIYRDVPIYRTRYTYEVDRWQEARTERAMGTDDAPHWPDPKLANREREKERDERYVVLLTDERERTHRLTLPLERWERFALGQSHPLQVDGFGRASLAEE